jgi:uncharacterized membrane protein
LILEEQQDYQSASSAYLIWPLALAALLREPATASRWTRIHTRQALMFGLVASIGFVVVLALPLLVVIADAGISTGTTVGLYTAGLLLDAIVFIVLTVLAFSYASRAGRGELFTIPIVSPLADRIFTIRR